MTDPTPNLDITIRGGLPTIIPSHTPPKPPRHQPDTPVNKKFSPQKPKPKKRQPKTAPTPTANTEPPPGETDNESTPPS